MCLALRNAQVPLMLMLWLWSVGLAIILVKLAQILKNVWRVLVAILTQINLLVKTVLKHPFLMSRLVNVSPVVVQLRIATFALPLQFADTVMLTFIYWMEIVLMNSNAKTLRNIIRINNRWYAQLVFLLVVNAQLKVYVKPVFLGTYLVPNVYWSVLLNIMLILYLEAACLVTQRYVWHVV